MTALVSVTGLSHRYGSSAVLDLPHWDVEAGKHQLVIGPSGSGKSTLLSILSGLLTPESGDIEISGQSLGKLAAGARDRFRGRHIGIVMQRLHLIAALNVRDNLRLAQSLAGLRVDDKRIDDVLNNLGVLAKAASKTRELSVGETQRVARARCRLPLGPTRRHVCSPCLASASNTLRAFALVLILGAALGVSIALSNALGACRT